ncbi:DUF676-domain-containing protein [Serendipita vermifera]|nr:DUF676-domain-containing protein [Serendipita vermifera]
MQEIHLLVAAHGMWGEPAHLAEIARIIQEGFPTYDADEQSSDGSGIKLHVLVAQTNTLDSTYDGVDWGGERIADETQKTIEELEKDGTHKVTRFSVVGYSLGGLLVRYLIGILNSRNFFDKVKPVNFTTFATPHAGVTKTKFFFSRLGHKLGPKLLSRTGPQFYCSDGWSEDGRPLLQVLADPKGIFYQGLAKFEKRSVYGSAFGDRTVSYSTALIESHDPFWDHETSGITIVEDEKYAPIVTSYSKPDTPPTPPPPPRFLSREYITEVATKPRLPPFLQFRFPLNVVLYVSLPVLIPLALSAAFIKVSLDANNSRKRLRILEKSEGVEGRLVNVLKKLDKGMENAVADLMQGAEGRQLEEEGTIIIIEEDDSTDSLNKREKGKRSEQRQRSMSTSERLADAIAHSPLILPSSSVKAAVASQGPEVLTPIQLNIIDTLNTLPIEKYAAHFPGVFNAHAVIISRDVKRFPFHKRGEGVLRHWADHFIL